MSCGGIPHIDCAERGIEVHRHAALRRHDDDLAYGQMHIAGAKDGRRVEYDDREAALHQFDFHGPFRFVIRIAGGPGAIVIAFVSQVAETIGPEGRYLHLGLTSSDVVDTGLALLPLAIGTFIAGPSAGPRVKRPRSRPGLMSVASRRRALGHQDDLAELCAPVHPLVGGVILFARNVESPEQVAELVAALKRAAGRHGGVREFTLRPRIAGFEPVPPP